MIPDFYAQVPVPLNNSASESVPSDSIEAQILSTELKKKDSTWPVKTSQKIEGRESQKVIQGSRAQGATTSGPSGQNNRTAKLPEFSGLKITATLLWTFLALMIVFQRFAVVRSILEKKKKRRRK